MSGVVVIVRLTKMTIPLGQFTPSLNQSHNFQTLNWILDLPSPC